MGIFSPLVMQNSLPEKTFQNPVYERSFPDPFVIKFHGKYFAYSTGIGADGRCFGRLRSDNLVDWEELPGSMEPLESGDPYYWAPEVTFRNGKFYMYYSVGNETLMTIRVAVSGSPDGAFVDAGIELTEEEFAIDPHVFSDDDGRWFMFYATDFLDYSHVGTGTAVDEMLDPFTLKGQPKPVTRAHFDWQVYDAARIAKGGVRWHTVEGPFVLKRKKIYYEMFSGGNWQNISYGVSFAVSKTLECDEEWSQYSDGAKIPPILRTIPNKVIGPGHNSVVRGLNEREIYCVYHRWENDIRVMAVDRMDFAGEGRLFIMGPSNEPQLFPYMPLLQESDLTLSPGQPVDINCKAAAGAFLCTFSFRFLEKSRNSHVRVSLNGEAGAAGEFRLSLSEESITAHYSNGFDSLEFVLPGNFDLLSTHQVRLEIDARYLNLVLDASELNFTSVLTDKVSGITLNASESSIEISSLTITGGFEDLFEADALAERGWTPKDKGHFHYKNLNLIATGDDTADAEARRNIPKGNNEVSINLRFDTFKPGVSSVGIRISEMFEIKPRERVIIAGKETFYLPEDFSADSFHQFRFVYIDGQTKIHIDALLLGEVSNTESDSLSIIIKQAEVAFDMIRYTLI